jgi:hypothetical protein
MKKYILIMGALVAGVAIAANEVTVNTLLRIKNGAYDVQRTVNMLDSQATSSADQGIMNATPVATAIPISNVVTPKWSYIRNLSTNTAQYIDVTCTIRLYGNDVAVMPIGNTNIQATAQAGTTNKLEYWINEK